MRIFYGELFVSPAHYLYLSQNILYGELFASPAHYLVSNTLWLFASPAHGLTKGK